MILVESIQPATETYSLGISSAFSIHSISLSIELAREKVLARMMLAFSYYCLWWLCHTAVVTHASSSSSHGILVPSKISRILYSLQKQHANTTTNTPLLFWNNPNTAVSKSTTSNVPPPKYVANSLKMVVRSSNQEENRPFRVLERLRLVPVVHSNNNDNNDVDDPSSIRTEQRSRMAKPQVVQYASSLGFRNTPTTAKEVVPHDANASTTTTWGKLKRATQTVWLFSWKQTQNIAKSNFWYHVPPYASPLLLVALVPSRQRITSTTKNEWITRQVIPFFAHSSIRKATLAGLSLALFSWGHASFRRNHYHHYRNTTSSLPPFLPEAVWDEPDPTTTTVSLDDIVPEETEEDDDTSSSFLHGLQRQSLVFTNAFREWNLQQNRREREQQRQRRASVFAELVATQRKRKQKQQQQQRGLLFSFRKGKQKVLEEKNEVGYALVTGASRGIGRALSVELARHDIPVILVARDEDKLTQLAYELESCYGVKTYVLRADLSEPGVAESIYETVQKAGLQVDILVNNAGISSQGNAFDMPISKMHEIIQVNTVSLSTLTHLFGKDMKERKRGRIMIMSSVCGGVGGLASVSLYAATKAFANSLSIGLAREMEPYGVGVTCVMPGAVKDTAFKSRSQSDEALCWKLPFYLKTPEEVASWSVRATLRGDTEVTIGWPNRVFLRLLKPSLPQRLHNLAAEIAWNPIHVPFLLHSRKNAASFNTTEPDLSPRAPTTLGGTADAKPSPQLLQLEAKEVESFSDAMSGVTVIGKSNNNMETVESGDAILGEEQVDLDEIAVPSIGSNNTDDEEE